MNESRGKVLNTAIIFTLLGILAILAGIYYQLGRLNDANRVELTRKIQSDMFQWKKEHLEAKAWINDPDSTLRRNYAEWDFDDYLGFYDDLYTLFQKNMIDKKLAYGFFSYELETIYKANNFELKALIDSFRVADNDPELLYGVEHLYQEFAKQRQTISEGHKPQENK